MTPYLLGHLIAPLHGEGQCKFVGLRSDVALNYCLCKGTNGVFGYLTAIAELATVPRHNKYQKTIILIMYT